MTIKNSQASVKLRQTRIHEFIKSMGMAKTDDIASRFRISSLTARRDLDILAQQGLIERFHGGAMVTEQGSGQADASGGDLGLKQAIAQRAAAIVNDYDTIFINSSSTALLILKYVTAKKITIITNNGKALFAPRPEDSNLVFTGGEIRFPKNAMVGDFAINNLSKVTANQCFIGCAGISLTHGVMSGFLQEAAINELMLRNTSGNKVILADHRRFDRIHPFKTCNVGDITHLVTDGNTPEETVAGFRQSGVKVLHVKPIYRKEEIK